MVTMAEKFQDINQQKINDILLLIVSLKYYLQVKCKKGAEYCNIAMIFV